MKNKAKLFGLYLPLYSVVLIVSVIMRTVALFNYFNFSTEYFNNKILITVSDTLVSATALILFTYIFVSHKNVKLIPDFTSPKTYVPTGAVSVALLFIIIPLIDKILYVKKYINILSMMGDQSSLAQIPSQRLVMAICILAALFAALSVIHFALTALIENETSKERAYFGLCTVVFLCLYATYVYFDTSAPINAPTKLLTQMAYLFSAVFFLFETRLSMRREKWSSYISFGFIASLITAYSSVPELILYLFGGKNAATTLYESALTFALFIFITARILLTSELIEDKPSPIIAVISKMADAREEEVNPHSHTSNVIDFEGEVIEDVSETDENQISIEDIESAVKVVRDDSRLEAYVNSIETEPQDSKEEATEAENEKDTRN